MMGSCSARLGCRNRTSAALLSLRYQISQAYREARRLLSPGVPDQAPQFQRPTRI
jgi:hypothetical protein